MSNFHIFTMVWGSHHVELFKKSCFRSLHWPKNLERIRGKDWFIYTHPSHFDEFQSLFKNSPFNLKLLGIPESASFLPGVKPVMWNECEQGIVLLYGLKFMIRHSIENHSRMLFAPPDTLFGDGTIPNMIEAGSTPGTAVTVAHPRVLPSILEEIDVIGATTGPISNAKLVTLFMRHAHDSWKYAEIGHEHNNSYVGGISWKKLESGLYLMQHRLPTAYFVDFVAPDVDFFWGQVSFGGWDHRWPSENLIRFERMRYVGSSDACFIVEVTDWDKNVPQKMDKKNTEGYPDDHYWNVHYHNSINRQFSVILRGE